jgi:hypothetical protein
VSPHAIPQALRPLPIRVRPRPAETVASYVVRLARANHLEPSYLHAYLCGPPNWHGAADLQRLAVLCGRPVAVLQRTLTGPTPARKPTPKPPSRPSKSPTPPGTATPRRPREPAAGSGHHNQPLEVGAAPTTPTSLPAPDGMAHPMGGWTGRLVDRKVWGTGVIGYAGAHYSVGRPFVGQTVQVGCADGMVHIFHGGQPLRAWPRRHPPANEASIQPARSHHDEMDLDQARRLAPLDDLDSDPRVVHRLVDPTGSVSFAGRYYLAGHYLAGQVVQVRCAGGIVQIIHSGELVRAWQQRHTPQQEQRMHQRPNIQQRTANARALTSPPQQQPAPADQPPTAATSAR